MMGMQVVFALGFIALFVAYFAFGSYSLDKIGWTTFNTLFNINWVPLPLFVLMACLIGETKIGEDIYNAARKWLSRIPGGLIITSIFGEAAMAAAVGTEPGSPTPVDATVGSSTKVTSIDSGASRAVAMA